jgi:acetyl/propionyl-CoA carboxylase alpha subunit
MLIANRGEIARRIIRTAKSMDITTFSVYTDEEKDALHVHEADKAVSLGSGALSETFLNIPLLISIAQENNCNAIHPGYGFLSENADFSAACSQAGIIFIGPEAETIRLMGDKSRARSYVQQLGVLLTPSVSGNSFSEVEPLSSQLKYPLIIKAVAGGGGKGMRIIKSPVELEEAWEAAGREALNYFGNSELYLEQYIENARHIEVQILGDKHGNIVHLFDRECSIQRRHQKIIEEAPSPTLMPEIRTRLLKTAVSIAKSLNYTSAGTLEFLFDQNLNFYFLEMNTRIQVEHPITEAITGIDIVKEQINIAQGGSLSFRQDEISYSGHAIECRVYAEDPFSDFTPSSGEILLYQLPVDPTIRIDSVFDGSSAVSSSFDPMIAKITAHSQNRTETIKKLKSYIKRCYIQGVNTNLEYLSEILEESDFLDNNISTHYCQAKTEGISLKLQSKRKDISDQLLIAFAVAKDFPVKSTGNVWKDLGPWRIFNKRSYEIGRSKIEVIFKHIGQGLIALTIGEHNYLVQKVENQESLVTFLLNGEKYAGFVTEDVKANIHISAAGLTFTIKRTDLPDTSIFSQKSRPSSSFNGNHVLSPLNGKVIKLHVKEGDKVEKGELLMIIESMKMENKILAPAPAVISEVLVTDGDQVSGSELLIKLSTLN